MDIHSEKILILDFGSQYTQLIARRLRELGVYCEIHPCTMKPEAMRAFAPRGIVLSGGPASVLAEGSPRADRLAFELGVPVLGICYGLQLIAHELGGQGRQGRPPRVRPATIETRAGAELFEGLPAKLDVWMSHGDRVEALPPGFEPIASTPSAPFAAVEDRRRRIFGVQFHPEVVHTPRGKDVLRNFAYRVCGCSRHLVDARLRGDRGRADPRPGEGRARHLRALRRRRLRGRRAARPPRHRRPAPLHLRRQRRAPRRRARAGRGGLRADVPPRRS